MLNPCMDITANEAKKISLQAKFTACAGVEVNKRLWYAVIDRIREAALKGDRSITLENLTDKGMHKGPPNDSTQTYLSEPVVDAVRSRLESLGFKIGVYDRLNPEQPWISCYPEQNEYEIFW